MREGRESAADSSEIQQKDPRVFRAMADLAMAEKRPVSASSPNSEKADRYGFVMETEGGAGYVAIFVVFYPLTR